MPIVISGFEPLDILQGTLITIRQLETERSEVENQYSRILDRDANKAAQKLVFQVFQIGDRKWRCIGTIPKSGYPLRPEFAEHDAARQNGDDPPMHCMRDPTRGGVAMTLNEIASLSKWACFCARIRFQCAKAFREPVKSLDSVHCMGERGKAGGHRRARGSGGHFAQHAKSFARS